MPQTVITLTKPSSLDTLSVEFSMEQSREDKPEKKEFTQPKEDFALFTIADSVGIVIIIRNPTEQVISWYIMDMNGKKLVSKRNTYLPGEVIESWKGTSSEGIVYPSGIYQVVAVAEADGGQITKSVVLNRRAH
jgi:hypothetical protein